MNNNKKLKEKELEILNKFDEICKKHNIKYYLAYGTALGAIRHNGFIPWDDDIDICLNSNDIIKLRKILKKECPIEYYYQDKLTDKYYYNYWSKFGLENTTWMPKERVSNCKYGICIDIWPLFPTSNTTLDRIRVKVFTRLLLITSAKYYVINKKEVNPLGKAFHKIMPNKINDALYNISFKILSKKKNNKYLVMYDIDHDKYVYFKKEEIEGDRTHIFEGKKYFVPNNLELYLRTFYGDYMTPPKVEDRYGHDTGDNIIYDFKNSYKKYIGDNNE